MLFKDKRVAILFAGQGAQTNHMGQALYIRFDEVRSLYAQANSILGYDLESIVFSDNALLHETQYAQPAIAITSIALYAIAMQLLSIQPVALAGLSLGEYSALYAAGVFKLSDTIQLIHHRASWMQEAAQVQKGAMAAILGLEAYVLEDICHSITNVVVANYNCPGQLVISGLESAVDTAIEKAKKAGARRAIRLNVNGAFHSFMMNPAADKLDILLSTMYPKPMEIDVISNVTGMKMDESRIKELMVSHMTSPVRFDSSIRTLINTYNVNLFIEIGPGSVLSGFVKKIDPNVSVISINTIEDIETLLKEGIL